MRKNRLVLMPGKEIYLCSLSKSSYILVGSTVSLPGAFAHCGTEAEGIWCSRPEGARRADHCHGRGSQKGPL